MPTVKRIGALRIVIWPNDHRPAHVHVIGPDVEATFHLHCPSGPVELRENYGFKLTDLQSLAADLEHVLADLCAEWSRIHGDY